MGQSQSQELPDPSQLARSAARQAAEGHPQRREYDRVHVNDTLPQLEVPQFESRAPHPPPLLSR